MKNKQHLGDAKSKDNSKNNDDRVLSKREVDGDSGRKKWIECPGWSEGALLACDPYDVTFCTRPTRATTIILETSVTITAA